MRHLLPVTCLLLSLVWPLAGLTANSHGGAAAADPTTDSESVERGGKTNPPLSPLPSAASRNPPTFTIYDASVAISGDYDHDGFYRTLRVNFDADLDHDLHAQVWAELFLSRDGGPWIRYHVSELFTIFSDDSDDDYEIETTLLEGYPAGQYSVAIDLFVPGRGFVTSLDGWEDPDLYALPLEDAYWDGHDDGFGLGVSSSVFIGGGGATGSGLGLLLGIVALRLRARRSH